MTAVFQITLTLTFEDSTSDACLTEIMAAYSNLARAVLDRHGCLLLQSVGRHPSDHQAEARIRALPGDPAEATQERRTYARDVLTLAAMERGTVARFDEGCGL